MELLARRAYASAALGAKLAARFTDSEVEAALARLAELGLLDDRAYAQSFVHERFERRGHGPLRIHHDLIAKGIDAELADAVIAEIIDDDSERSAAERALRRYLERAAPRRPRAGAAAAVGAHGTPETARNEAAFRHLTARGFADELVRDLLGVSL